MNDNPDGVYFVAAGDLHTGQIPVESLDALFSRVKDIPDARFFSVAGDLTDTGRAEDYAILHPFIDSLPMPFYGVMGNHDTHTGHDSTARALFRQAMNVEDASYRRDLDGISFVFLSAEYQTDGCTVEITRSLHLLEETLAAGAGPVVAFCHAPLTGTVGAMPGRPSFVSNDPQFGLPSSPQVRTLIEKAGRPVVWISGHTHSDIDAENLFLEERLNGCPLNSVNLGSPYYTGRDGRREAPILLYHFHVTKDEASVQIEDIHTRAIVREERLSLVCRA